MTEPKDKTLIQRGDFLFCTECDCAWAIGEDERHDSKCMWYVPPMPDVPAVGTKPANLAPMPTWDAVTPVVPAGWICSRCQRVFAPYVSECPHCQPGICSTGG